MLDYFLILIVQRFEGSILGVVFLYHIWGLLLLMHVVLVEFACRTEREVEYRSLLDLILVELVIAHIRLMDVYFFWRYFAVLVADYVP